MRIALGNDHVGLELKNKLDIYLEKKKIDVKHFGAFTDERMDYPEIGFKVAEAISEGKLISGILICGTGVGMSIAANRVNGIRAVVCSEPYSAKMAREHNDANILCIGARVIGSEMAQMILEQWFNSKYEGNRHQRRVDMINNYEK